ncbi:MAG TPA: hypothetical protein DCG19_04710 [Cryomorphaceae bacterium]|nr:hypothetical protein [Owenweeksia sp.]MBF99987.1 hypothetical protein [Owenweeksia sp.]HAD96684.1 hypothetical protein [Cryomorphaceae bacterium]HBF18923.1 hypothetical protein [Cryomorphaceae bacterium]
MQRILFHVGPPKTGTSFIQDFLNRNRAQLLQQGIYYPEHYVDPNGVSTGNRDSVYSKDHFDRRKLEQLIQKAEVAGAHTLLFSSEAFYRDVMEIHDNCPQAEFILYLRQPLQNMESYHNQAVKRNRKTEKFTIANIDYSRFIRLKRYLDHCGQSCFTVRYYQKQCFRRNSLIADFLQSLSIPMVPEKSNSVINPSYSLSALELKRRLNALPLSKYADYQLDKVLQNYKGGQQHFSLTPPEEYARYLDQIVDKLDALLSGYELPGWEDYLHALREDKPKPYHREELSPEEAIRVAQFIHDQNHGLYSYLSRKVWQNADPLMEKAFDREEANFTDWLIFQAKAFASKLLR